MNKLLNTALALLDKIAAACQPYFLLLIRVYFGYRFIIAGYGKFTNFDKTVGFFSSIGLPAPEINVFMAASTELVGGILILIGLFTRPAAFFLSFTMCVAYLTAHNQALFNFVAEPNKFFAEAPFPFLFTSLVLLLFGAGKFSVDRK